MTRPRRSTVLVGLALAVLVAARVVLHIRIAWAFGEFLIVAAILCGFIGWILGIFRGGDDPSRRP